MALRDKCSEQLNQVIDALLYLGADVYFVGGCVRDDLLGLPIKDFDIEVFHLSSEKIEACLRQFGHYDVMGKNFGIYKLYNLPEADFALPRSEYKTGKRHQDFRVEVNPDLSIEKAARRRDFTMNAIYYDARKRAHVDPYGGMKDLTQGIIKVVDKETFVEDPLRVLRLAQFLSRLDFKVEDNTKLLCQQMVHDHLLDYLSKERITVEYEKLLLGKKPSKGLAFLKEVHALPEELDILSKIHQRADYHPEGSAWNHTLAVVDAASVVKEKTSWPLGFMWSALLHDIGKSKTTDDFGHAYGHEIVGADMAMAVLGRLQKNRKLMQYVHVMIENHMKLKIYQSNHAKDKTFLKLLWHLDGKTTLNDLYYLTQSDILGCGRDTSDSIKLLNDFLKEKVSRLGDKAPEPFINGKDLLDLGFVAGPDMKLYLEEAYKLQLSGQSKEAILKGMQRRKLNGTRKSCR